MNGVDGGGGGGIRFPLNSLLCLPRAHVQQASSQVAAGTGGPQVTSEARSFLGFQHSWGIGLKSNSKGERPRQEQTLSHHSALQLGQDPGQGHEEAHTQVQNLLTGAQRKLQKQLPT